MTVKDGLGALIILVLGIVLAEQLNQFIDKTQDNQQRINELLMSQNM